MASTAASTPPASAASGERSRFTLSAEQITRFHRDGFLAIERLVSDVEVEHLRQALVRLFANRAGWAQGEQFDLAGNDADPGKLSLPQVLGPSRFAPELLESSFRARAFDIANQLLGGPFEELELSVEHAILKPALHGAQTPWHQDEAYWRMPGHDARCVTVWMPLQDATIENGCLWYVPGSHQGHIRPHRPIGGDPKVQGLETLEVDPSLAVPVPLRAGGAVVHHIRSLHFAGTNATSMPRYAYSTAMHRPSVPAAVPHHMPPHRAAQALAGGPRAGRHAGQLSRARSAPV